MIPKFIPVSKLCICIYSGFQLSVVIITLPIRLHVLSQSQSIVKQKLSNCLTTFDTQMQNRSIE